MTAPNNPTPLPLSLSAAVQGRSILIVDDEPMIRRVAQLALAGAGHSVAEAGDAAAAVAAVRSAEKPFDIILLDVTLPDGEGTTVIPVIRRHAPATRILVVSGLGDMDASGMGADGFLAKPFTKSSLLVAVQLALAAATAAPVPPAGDR
jgi:DNA-binding response OmpR family regulator